MPGREQVSPEQIRTVLDETIRAHTEKLLLEMRGRIGYCAAMRAIYEAQVRLK